MKPRSERHVEPHAERQRNDMGNSMRNIMGIAWGSERCAVYYAARCSWAKILNSANFLGCRLGAGIRELRIMLGNSLILAKKRRYKAFSEAFTQKVDHS